MSLLLDIFGFLSVILRGLTLVAQSFTLGGLAFFGLLLQPLARRLPVLADPSIYRPCQLVLRVSAFTFALAALAAMGLNAAVLVGTVQLSWGEALSANFAHADLTVALCAMLIGVLGNDIRQVRRLVMLAALGGIALAAQLSVTHAASRLGLRWPFLMADGMHMLGAAVWIGGLPYFLIALNRIHDGAGWRLVGRRYSLLSMAGVGGIVIGGTVMAIAYIGSVAAIWGTAYGIMVSTKLLLLLMLMLLGSFNYRTVEALRRDPATPVKRLKRFVEVEIGIGLTVLFAAASLTSLPPGVDLTQDRVSLHEIVERLTPQFPIRLASPDHDTLSIPMLQAKIAAADAQRVQAPQAYVPGEGILMPRNAEDIAWSEYNHHWAGIFVALIGLLALVEHCRWGRWAKHWPLIFLGMAGFLFFRSDPEVWPLGQVGFFDSLRDPEVVQHRIFVLLITLFGLFEWRVRTGGHTYPKAALVFPLITAIGGALLLTHSHALANIKDQLLAEVSHVPLALCGITAGWARWLELRLDGKASRIAGRIWPIAFVLVGLILLEYREA